MQRDKLPVPFDDEIHFNAVTCLEMMQLPFPSCGMVEMPSYGGIGKVTNKAVPGDPALNLTASEKVHLRRCASRRRRVNIFPSLSRGQACAYFYICLISQDCPRFAWTPHPLGGSPVSRALHLELFTVPSVLTNFCEVINNDALVESRFCPLLT